MIRIYVICEGQTEETFVRDILSPLFATNNLFMTAQMIPTSKTQKGGALSYERVKRYIERLLKQEHDTYVTTFFDLYALDNKFPKIKESRLIDNLYEKVEFLEKVFVENIVYDDHFKNRFLPHIQPYEFEGLLFSDVAKLIEIDSDWDSNLVEKLQIIRNQFETPEHINDSIDTSPSHRLQSLLKYQKTLHGPLAIENIGIDKVLTECKHFEQWYNKLLNLK